MMELLGVLASGDAQDEALSRVAAMLTPLTGLREGRRVICDEPPAILELEDRKELARDVFSRRSTACRPAALRLAAAASDAGRSPMTKRGRGSIGASPRCR
jgi:hypothetical protein